ncbi:hypothetical protein NEDG_01947 [Nematocida displodere]|uniref:DUF155 domain-containing protein n=1 Tax=Nematocida displodere TaxID=1805483 RepID=A0A177EJ45_9MICR|nr:hypothetical protein NEDG_01947 [Nematocida displodere]
MEFTIEKSMPYTEPNGNKKTRIESRRVGKEILELKTVPVEEKQFCGTDKATELRDIVVLCTAEKIDTSKFYKWLKERSTPKEINIYFRDCVHLSIPEIEDTQKGGDIFIFKYGVTVLWGIDAETKNRVLAQQRCFEEKSYRGEAIQREEFRFGIVQEGASIVNDVIYLDTDSPYNKMIISNALAQSTKLDIFEEYVEKTTERVQGLPDEIVSKGFTTKKREDVLKMIGVLHRLKFNLNLATNIMETPEILWYYPNYTSLYESFKLYLELKSRAEILNHKCDVIHEILTLLSTHISTKNSERLEKIIIILICVETVIACLHLALSWNTSRG